MALFLAGSSRCPLCGKVLFEHDDWVGTSHFIANEYHPLYRFSDAVMHRGCFLKWDKRAEFVAIYNSVDTMHFMKGDGTIRRRLVYWIAHTAIDILMFVSSWFQRTDKFDPSADQGKPPIRR